MQLIPYLTFNGNCEEAMTFYAKVFGGKMGPIMRFGDMPASEGMPPLPESAKNGVMHAYVKFGEQEIMGSDTMPEGCAGGGYQAPQGINVNIAVDNVEEGRRVFNALAEGGKVTMPFDKTFWSAGFGMVTDRFNTPWMVNVFDPQAPR
ncbi:VOC family protein [Diaphorobacter aerolatus]|uniref:VOC family protein n=1 Tax=Diaphorobacter aerolatus TaxID=1288495 RepID=A0A7H0GG50_9BURK|nr:VOC family protein [Diaphorobacter aerolatus]QNP47266.1 VOC family protein [Diaphorobacter aerolatus]